MSPSRIVIVVAVCAIASWVVWSSLMPRQRVVVPAVECPEYQFREVEWKLQLSSIASRAVDWWRGRKDDKFDTIRVLFGTDRALGEYQPHQKTCLLLQDKNIAVRRTFGRERGEALLLGQAEISIPKVHFVGTVERPDYQILGLTWYQDEEDPARHFTIRWISVDPQIVFAGHARQFADAAKIFKRKALVYVHGYNMTFQSALFRAAQLAYDIGFDGPVFAYSWPASGSIEDYVYDSNSALRTAENLKNFLQIVAAVPSVDAVEIVAHSLGSLALLYALKQLHDEGAELAKFRRVIFAAPDIDKNLFATLSKEIRRRKAHLTTVYASANDRALKASSTIAGGVERVGGIYGEAPLLFSEVDVIDVSSAKTDYFGLNHSAYAENFLLLNDIAILLRDGIRPPSRRTPLLRERALGSELYWKYP